MNSVTLPSYRPSALILSVLCCLAGPAAGQPADVGSEEPAGVTDVRSRIVDRLLSDAADAVAGKRWLDAAQAVDRAWEAVSAAGDPLSDELTTVTVVRLQPETITIAAGRAKVESFFRSSPAALQDAYTDQIGPIALAAVREAGEGGSADDLLQQALRFRLTPQGDLAAEAAIARLMAAGRLEEAAVQTEALSRRSRESADSVQQQLRAAGLWLAAGLSERAAGLVRNALSQTDALQAAGISPSSQGAATEEWIREITGIGIPADASGSRVTRQLFDGIAGADTSGLLRAEPRFAWRHDVFRSLAHPETEAILSQAAERLHQNFSRPGAQAEAFFPVGMPLITDELVLVRGPANIHALDTATGQVKWESFPLDASLSAMVETLRRDSAVSSGIADRIRIYAFMALKDHLTRANPAGQLTVQNGVVAAVEDISEFTWTLDSQIRLPQQGDPSGIIRFYDLRSGRQLAEVGGEAASASARPQNAASGFYFLGTPFALGDRSYVLAEGRGSIDLISMPLPRDSVERDALTQNWTSQRLRIPRYPLTQHPARKYCGAVPALAGGTLVCETSAGSVVGLSAADQSVSWVFRYPSIVRPVELGGDFPVLGRASTTAGSESIDQQLRWLDSVPRAAGPYVLLTPRDSDQLYCLNASDGSLVWSVPRAGMRMLVHSDETQVLLCGQDSVAALDVTSGNELWNTPLGSNAVRGRPAVSDRVVYLPVSPAGIITLQRSDGRILLHTELDESRQPGNLTIHGDRLFSQGIRYVDCYDVSPLSETADSVAFRIAEARTRMLNGDPDEAVALLRSVAERVETNSDRDPNESADSESAQLLLAEWLLEGLRVDYERYSGDIPAMLSLLNGLRPSADQSARLAELSFSSSIDDVDEMRNLLEAGARRRRIRDRLTGLSAEQLAGAGTPTVETLAAGLPSLLQSAIESGSRTQEVGGITVRTARRVAAIARRAAKRLTEEDRRKLADVLTTEGSGVRTSLQSAPAESALWLRDAGFPEVAEMIIRDSGFSAEQPSESEQLQALLRLLRPQFPVENAAPDSPVWPKKWTVRSETARSLQGGSDPRRDAPYLVYSVVGNPTAFTDWSFASPLGRDEIRAWDSYGRLRWSYDAGQLETSSDDRLSMVLAAGGSQYIQFVGPVAVIRVGHLLLALDTENAAPDQAPRLLWELNLSTLLPQVTNEQAFVTGSRRVDMYHYPIGGLFPVGRASSCGVPLYSGNTLLVVDLLTGETQWEVRRQPGDAELLGTEDSVLMLSPGAGVIAQRSLVDGELLGVSELPDWWTQAEENIPSSPLDLTMEPGEKQLWRVAVRDSAVILFEVSVEGTRLLSRDLLTGRDQWAVEFPADALCSNEASDTVIVLDSEDRVTGVSLTDGAIRFRTDVPPMPYCRQLFLRPTADHLVLMTLSEPPGQGPESDDYPLPVSDSVLANGWIVALSREDGTVDWTDSVDNEFIRRLRPDQGAHVTAAPVLPLISRRYNPPRADSPIVGAHYEARVLDLRTGEEVFSSPDIGRTLNWHALRFDSSTGEIRLDFEEQIYTLVPNPE